MKAKCLIRALRENRTDLTIIMPQGREIKNKFVVSNVNGLNKTNNHLNCDLRITIEKITER